MARRPISERFTAGTQHRAERLYPGAAVIVVAGYAGLLVWFALHDIRFDRIFLAQKAAVRAVNAQHHPLTLDQPVAIVRNGHTAPGIALLTGWSNLEPWGVWSEGRFAALSFAVAPHPPTPLVALIQIAVMLDPRGRQALRVDVNGIPVGRWVFHASAATLTIPIPPADAATGALRLDFHIETPTRPHEIADPRLLGIGLQRFLITAAGLHP